MTGLRDSVAAASLRATSPSAYWLEDAAQPPLLAPLGGPDSADLVVVGGGYLGLWTALLSFSLSFDDFIITNLNAGQTTTFPMFVYGAAQRGVPMQVNVIGSLMFVISIVIVVGNELNNRRRAKALAR